MAIWVPPRAAREAMDARREYEHEINLIAEHRAVCEYWDGELQKIDPHLSIFFAPEWANVAGVTPGRYHIMVQKPDQPLSLLPVSGAVGEFVEPSTRMLDMLRASDLWSEAVGRDRAKKEAALEQVRDRAKVRESEERREEFRDRAKAHFSPSVSMADTGSWRYRAGARTEKKAA